MHMKKELVNQIISLYNDGLSKSKITKYLNVSIYTVDKILKINNVTIRHQNDNLLQNYEHLKDLYFSGVSLTQLSKMFKISRNSIARLFKNNNISVINSQNVTKFNDTIFDIIDTEEKAYWLGFIFADGNISKEFNTLEISLQANDCGHLKKFLNFLNHNNPNLIHYRKIKGHNTCRVNITNKHLKNVLVSYGCVPNKSLILKFPDKNIFKSEDLIKHFIRGYFDGDGCISYNKYFTKSGIKISPMCSVISTKNFIEITKKYLASKGIKSVICKDKRHHENTRILRFYQKDSRKLLNYLYTDCCIYLDRKYNRALFFKGFCRSLKEFNELLSSEIGEGCDANPEISSEITKGSETL